MKSRRLRGPLAATALLFTLAGAGLLLAEEEAGGFKLHPGTVVRFSSVEQGRRILGSRDEYLAALSPFDRSARLKTAAAVDEKSFIKFITGEVLPWSEEETSTITRSLQAVSARLAGLKLSFPREIHLVQTSGKEEGGAAYCRGSAVVLPARIASRKEKGLTHLLLHELFHILSRNQPELREKLSVVPVLYSSAEKYDEKKGGEFFRYLVFRLMAVKKESGKWVPALVNGKPRLLDPAGVEDFHRKIGKNTGYIIHPEEVLADNFVLLDMGKKKVPTPRILEEMARLLKGP
ncbi:MAG: hypothetical protein MK479_00285 [Planctomycetes bacterium]|nr:hypothetical protein [Planctomycetota bacterium]